MNTFVEQAVMGGGLDAHHTQVPMFFQTVAPDAMSYNSPESMASFGLEQGLREPLPQDETSLSSTDQKWGKQPLEEISTENLKKDSRIMCDFIEESNLFCEPIDVYTPDSFQIRMFRVRKIDTVGAKPVFLQHGFMSDSTAFAVHTDKSLAMVLANKGYDVFVGNNRGNYYGRKHGTMDPDDVNDKKQYFNYSFYELSSDVLAQLKKASEMVGYRKMPYIGHSEGTSLIFSALADHTAEWKDRISMVIALAPVVYMGHMDNKELKAMAERWEGYYYTVEYGLGIHEFNDKGNQKQKEFCEDYSNQCDSMRKALFPDSKYHDEDASKRWREQPLTSASTKQLTHFAQLIKKDQFIQFDYLLKDKNVQYYNAEKPPTIELKNIPYGIPIALLVGMQDDLCSRTDVTRLKDELKGELQSRVVIYKEYDQFDHNSFMVGKNMDYTQDVVEMLAKYS